MDLKLAIVGDLQKDLDRDLRAIEKGVTTAVVEQGDEAHLALRRETQARLGKKVARAWRKKKFPAGASMSPAMFIYSKAPKIVRAFSEDTLIRSKDGFFLAIPTENAPKRGVGRKRISPANWPEHRFGRLRFVYRRSGPSLLVVDGLRASHSRKTGEFRGFRKNQGKSKRGGTYTRLQGSQTVVMFLLVPQARLKKRLNPKKIERDHSRRLPGRIAREVERELALNS